MRTVFIRGLTSESGLDSESVTIFRRDPQQFRLIASSPFAYWASDAVFRLFGVGRPTESGDLIVRSGMATQDDTRWLRIWFEARPDGSLRPVSKGGGFSRYYRDLEMGVLWGEDGNALATSKSERFRLGELTENNSKLWNRTHYGKAGIVWTKRTQGGFSARALPSGAIFGDKGPAIICTSTPDVRLLLATLAVVNSQTYRYLIGLQAAFGSYETGVIRRTPLPDLSSPEALEGLASLAAEAWSLKRQMDQDVETSRAFVLPPAARSPRCADLRTLVESYSVRLAETLRQLADVQGAIDVASEELYQLSPSDIAAIRDGRPPDEALESDVDAAVGNEDSSAPLEAALAAGLVSWTVGVGMGRFDVRLATGERSVPAQPGPFEVLPVCSPGMLAGEDGLPLSVAPDDYPIETSTILVTDPGHASDISARVRSVFEVVFGQDADAWWGDVSLALGGRGGELDAWLGKGFFDSHLKAHSKSRRKAPILWPLGTASGSYLVWLYAHRVTGDSLFQVLHDFVAPKVALEDQRLTQLRQDAGPSPAASQRREIDKKSAFVDELRDLANTVESVAPLWSPDLNDGIVIVLAPLWRLFAHHRAWSKELKSNWARLVAGEYDWAQLAMHLWPERVVPKCAEDRSLAIAHGLEDVFWVRDDSGSEKWHPRKFPTTPVEQLIAQRHNPAVVAALAGQP